MSGRVSSRRTNTARPKSAMSEILSHAGGAEGEVKMINGGKVPSLGNLRDRLPTQRSEIASVMSGYTDESARMDELAKAVLLAKQSSYMAQRHVPDRQVKKELEDALSQVKQEMKDGGATKSQLGASTVRSSSVMSSVSRAPSSMSRSMSRAGRNKTQRPGTASTRPDTAMSGASSLTLGSDWGTNENVLGGQAPKRIPGGMKTGLLPTNRGRNKLNLKDNEKPIVPRPIAKGAKVLPAPKKGAFKHAEFETSNQSEYRPLGVAGPRINQGPTRAPSGRNKEHHRMFSKECEAQVASSAITGSAVFGSRLTAQ